MQLYFKYNFHNMHQQHNKNPLGKPGGLLGGV